MRTLARAVAALIALGWLSGCSDHPERFQNACDHHLAAASEAATDGDLQEAKDELNNAANWVDAAYKDTHGSERASVDAFAKGVGVALYQFGTEEGRQGLADAQEACS